MSTKYMKTKPRERIFKFQQLYQQLVARLPSFSSKNLEIWQDPAVFRENVLHPHTPLRVLESIDECLVLIRQSSSSKELNPKWIRKLVDSEKPIKLPFTLLNSPKEVPDLPSSINFDIELPAPMNWQLAEELEDIHPIYTNLLYPWKRKGFGIFKSISYHVPWQGNNTGIYALAFRLDQSWYDAITQKKRKLYLILHGVSSAVKVFLHDDFVGYSQDSMTECEFDLTKFIVNAKNNEFVIYLIVFQWSDGSYLEDQDHWWMSGVFRDVEIQCRSSTSITDYSVETVLIDEKKATIVVHVNFVLPNKGDYSLETSLWDHSGKKLQAESSASIFTEDSMTVLELEVQEPILWSSENPYLYNLIVALVDHDGTGIHAETCKVGIRSIDIINGQLLCKQGPIVDLRC